MQPLQCSEIFVDQRPVVLCEISYDGLVSPGDFTFIEKWTVVSTSFAQL